jgi:Icc-related predicted phosphoesterase
MWNHVLSLVPGMFINRFKSGRFLDIFVTHSPPRGIHEGQDWTHQGIKAFRWLIDTFKPSYHLHGHIHYYHPDDRFITQLGETAIINAYRSQVIDINILN